MKKEFLPKASRMLLVALKKDSLAIGYKGLQRQILLLGILLFSFTFSAQATTVPAAVLKLLVVPADLVLGGMDIRGS